MTTQFAITDGAGVVLRLENSDLDIGDLELQSGEVAIEAGTPYTNWPDSMPGVVLMIDGSGVFSWDDTRTLSDAKTGQQAMIREERAADDAAGFTWDGDTFASDLVSQSRINTAMLSAIVAQRDAATLSIDWPLIDGSFRALDQDDLVALGQALYAHLAAGLAAEKEAYDDITAATTIPDVVSVGWPP